MQTSCAGNEYRHVAKARTATVKVCVPAFPPIEATIGIKTASATIASMVDEN